MPLTIDQIEHIAESICPLLKIKALQWPNPYRIDLRPTSLPEEVIEDAHESLQDDTGFGFRGRRNGPLGLDIKGGYIEITVDERGCLYHLAVRGGYKPGSVTAVLREVLTDWEDV
jgi:hypothetical protein